LVVCPYGTPEEAQIVVSKILSYEHSASESWRNSALVITDQNEGNDFEEAGNEVSAKLSGAMKVERISHANAKTELLEKLQSGGGLVNYLGHGSVANWRGDVLNSELAGKLTNGSRLPIYVKHDVSNGYFMMPIPKALPKPYSKPHKAEPLLSGPLRVSRLCPSSKS